MLLQFKRNAELLKEKEKNKRTKLSKTQLLLKFKKNAALLRNLEISKKKALEIERTRVREQAKKLLLAKN